MKCARLVYASLLLLYTVLALAPDRAAAAGGNATLDANEAGPDFVVQGEYSGEIEDDGGKRKVGIQVIALGKGTFRAFGCQGGLPGDGWNGKERESADGKTEGDLTTFENDEGKLIIKGDVGTVEDTGGKKIGELKKVIRKSPTLGKEPPKGAVILFGKDSEGKLTSDFPADKVSDDGLLMQGVTSGKKFDSFTAHIEFLIPYMPEASGQGRGNSGCYFQGRYEVQMLDSFALAGKDNECGGIYSIASPKVNMCFPPLSWQTYDVEFTAAQYEGDKKVKDATITVKHNGVVVHEEVKLTHATTASPSPEGPGPGPLFFQDHGNPVRYRNIWIVEKK